MLKLPVALGGQCFPVSLSLVVDPAMGATLVDTTGPGSEAAIVGTLAEVGVGMGDLRRIVLTHHDLDHVGSAVRAGAGQRRPRLAHQAEAPFVDGSQQPRFAQPAMPLPRRHTRRMTARVWPTLGAQVLLETDWQQRSGTCLRSRPPSCSSWRSHSSL